jgi:hypothetical protein
MASGPAGWGGAEVFRYQINLQVFYRLDDIFLWEAIFKFSALILKL